MKTEAVFTKTEMNNEWYFNVLLSYPLGIHHTHSTEFSIGRSTFETPMLYY